MLEEFVKSWPVCGRWYKTLLKKANLINRDIVEEAEGELDLDKRTNLYREVDSEDSEDEEQSPQSYHTSHHVSSVPPTPVDYSPHNISSVQMDAASALTQPSGTAAGMEHPVQYPDARQQEASYQDINTYSDAYHGFFMNSVLGADQFENDLSAVLSGDYASVANVTQQQQQQQQHLQQQQYYQQPHHQYQQQYYM
jgi:hypothetical protein